MLEQLIGVLQVEHERAQSSANGAPQLVQAEETDFSEIGRMAARHGMELSQRGLSVENVVQDYGDLCQIITDVAFERGAPIQVREFRALNRCLDLGIASAMTEFSALRLARSEAAGADRLHEGMSVLAHEVRNLVLTARLAARIIKRESADSAESSLNVLERALTGLQTLVDRSLADLQHAALPVPRLQALRLADFFADLEAAGLLESQMRGCTLKVDHVDDSICLLVDRNLLFAAVWNLLQNAFKFTAHNTVVTLHASAAAGRVRIEVHDHCGGLLPGVAESLFQPFVQHGADRSGLGLGLTICNRIVTASGGQLSVRDIPGSGCVFAIDLPCHDAAGTQRGQVSHASAAAGHASGGSVSRSN
jgi:hypothetical protein